MQESQKQFWEARARRAREGSACEGSTTEEDLIQRHAHEGSVTEDLEDSSQRRACEGTVTEDDSSAESFRH